MHVLETFTLETFFEAVKLVNRFQTWPFDDKFRTATLNDIALLLKEKLYDIFYMILKCSINTGKCKSLYLREQH